MTSLQNATNARLHTVLKMPSLQGLILTHQMENILSLLWGIEGMEVLTARLVIVFFIAKILCAYNRFCVMQESIKPDVLKVQTVLASFLNRFKKTFKSKYKYI